MIFIIKKLLGNLLVLPGLFILTSLALLTALIKGRKRLAVALGAALTLSLYLFSTELGKDLILKPLEDAYPYPKELKCSYIVVLGGGLTYSSPARGGRPEVRPQVAKRLYEAFKVWKRLRAPVVVSGGAFRAKESEAQVMKEFLVELGLPAEEILVEGRSRTTYENALYTRKLIGNEEVCLVTSAYHIPRSVLIFKSFGFKVVPVPADYRVNRVGYNFYSFLPFPDYLSDTLYGFREYVGIAFFRAFSKWRAREDSNLRPTD